MKIAFAALAATTMLASVLPAHAATVLDFRTLAPGTAVSDQYSGVSFSLFGGSASGTPEIAYYTNGVFGGLSNSPTAGEYPTAQRLVATFSQPVSGLKFTFDNEGFNGFNYYSALDGLGNVLATGALSQDVNFTYDLSSLSGVSTVFWDNGYADIQRSWTQALGTLEFTPSAAAAVPEPSTWAMMLVGFGAIGLGMRRKRNYKVNYSFA